MAVLPENAGVVPSRLQCGHYIWHVGPGGHETHGSRAVTVPTRRNDGPAGGADRGVHVGPVEEHALGGKGIEVGRQVLWLAPVDAERFRMEVIRGEEQNVGSLVLGPEGEALEGDRGGQ